MRTRITNTRLLDPATGLDQTGDLLIEDGVIAGIGDAPGDADETIDAEGLCLAPGLIDLRVKTGEPGNEHLETIATASRAAVSGGVTSMVIMPDTNPVIDDVALVEFITRRGEATALNRIYPSGALTAGLQSESMAEIGLLKEAGAVFFSNGEHSVSDPSVMKRALIYAKSHEATICTRAEDAGLIGTGVMNAGSLAQRMGLAGMGEDAELAIVNRDLMLAGYAGTRFILDQVSTARSIQALEAYQSEGKDVHATVAAHSLFFNELDIGDYLTYCKVSPPFRAETERIALIDALKRGSIAAVVSAHNPQPPETKRLPFVEAAFGAAGLETTLSALLTLVADERLTLLEALRPLTSGPADLMGWPQGRLKLGAPADLVLFDPVKPWACKREDLLSRSTNSPFDGRLLQGRAMMTIVDGNVVFERQVM